MEIEIKDNKALITFVLFAYNQEQFIEEAIEGAFSQTYTPLEIILSDDCSPDGTFAIMEKLANEYKGPHKIILNRNKKNLGLINHVNKVFSEVANGEIIVVAAGDDISLPERVKQTWNIFKKNSNIMSTSMEYTKIDVDGNVLKNINKFCRQGKYTLGNYIKGEKIPIYGATRAYRKEVFDVFGSLTKSHAEDVPLMFRSLLIGETWHQAELAILYRIQPVSLGTLGGSASAIKSILNQTNKDFEFAIEKRIIKEAVIEPLKLRMRIGLIIANIKIGYNVSKFKIFYFLRYMLFSTKFPLREKKVFFLLLSKKLLPNMIIKILNKFR